MKGKIGKIPDILKNGGKTHKCLTITKTPTTTKNVKSFAGHPPSLYSILNNNTFNTYFTHPTHFTLPNIPQGKIGKINGLPMQEGGVSLFGYGYLIRVNSAAQIQINNQKGGEL